MPKKKQTLETMTGEKKRLLSRQIELAELLDAEDTPLDDIPALTREQTDNAGILVALEPRLARLRAERERDNYEARQAAIRALRPQERDAFLDVVAAAEAMHQTIKRAEAVYRELHQVGGSPLTSIPAQLVQMVKPGPNGSAHWWTDTVDRIRL